MKNVFSKIKQASAGEIINFTCFAISILLGVIAFFIPPKGQIDSSVLMFVAEIGVFATISKVPDFIRAVSQSHTNLEIKKGETTIKISDEDDGDKRD